VGQEIVPVVVIGPPEIGVDVAIFVTVPMPLKEEGGLNDGGAGAPPGFPKIVPAAAFDSVNESAGVVVGFATLVANSGERFPELKLVTVPPPPLSTNHVQGGNPVSRQTCSRLSVLLKYIVPGFAPNTSPSV
jgi:hypothetical protein